MDHFQPKDFNSMLTLYPYPFSNVNNLDKIQKSKNKTFSLPDIIIFGKNTFIFNKSIIPFILNFEDIEFCKFSQHLRIKQIFPSSPRLESRYS